MIENLEPSYNEKVSLEDYEEIKDYYEELYEVAVERNDDLEELIELIFTEVDRDDKDYGKALQNIVHHIKTRDLESKVSKGILYEIT